MLNDPTGHIPQIEGDDDWIHEANQAAHNAAGETYIKKTTTGNWTPKKPDHSSKEAGDKVTKEQSDIGGSGSGICGIMSFAFATGYSQEYAYYMALQGVDGDPDALNRFLTIELEAFVNNSDWISGWSAEGWAASGPEGIVSKGYDQENLREAMQKEMNSGSQLLLLVNADRSGIITQPLDDKAHWITVTALPSSITGNVTYYDSLTGTIQEETWRDLYTSWSLPSNSVNIVVLRPEK